MNEVDSALSALAAKARGNPRALAALSNVALTQGLFERSYQLALEARRLAPDNSAIRIMTQASISDGVPRWHFRIVRDERRNATWEAALARAITAETRVLDIGTGSSLLALMAARAGAGMVIGCEQSRPVADAAARIVIRNGYSDKVRVIPKRSTDLDPAVDMDGRVDLVVSEIISSNLLSQGVLPVLGDAVRRLLRPGGCVIPGSASIRIALAHWSGMDLWRLSEVSGFDLTPFNLLDRAFTSLQAGDPSLTLASEPAELFAFDFACSHPPLAREVSVELVAKGGPINGIAQWIHIGLDAESTYENRPGQNAESCWAVLFYPFLQTLDLPVGRAMTAHGAHDETRLHIWTANSPSSALPPL